MAGDNRFHRRALFGHALAGAGMNLLPAAANAAEADTKFDFDTPYNRFGTDSTKWDAQERRFGKGSIVAGMGISDMDFRAAPVITRAIAERTKHENWGYLDMPHSFTQAILDYNRRRYGIDIHPERILLSTGVHPSIVSALRAFSPAGSKVITFTPTYDGFYGDIASANCVVEHCPLKQVNGRYQVDLEVLDRHIDRFTNSLILCNPNNPTGNAWTKEELLAIGELCTRRRVVVLVDEIHCDFVFSGHKYTPYVTLPNRDVVMNSVTFKSASKSFSLSAMKCGWMYSENADYIARIAATGHSGDINTLGVVAARAALNEGEPWLNQLVPYIEGNHEFVEKFVRQNIPLFHYSKPDATYLAFLEVGAAMDRIAKPNEKATPGAQLQTYLARNAKVLINPGINYGPGGERRMRMNIATSRKTLELALTNIAEVLRRA